MLAAVGVWRRLNSGTTVMTNLVFRVLATKMVFRSTARGSFRMIMRYSRKSSISDIELFGDIELFVTDGGQHAGVEEGVHDGESVV